MALTVGATACVIAVIVALLRTTCGQLAHDTLVVRALALTYLVAAIMLARVAIECSAGVRRAFALLVASLFAVLALVLAVRPEIAAQFYDQGRSFWVPWALGAPGISALLLSRWRVA